jgi:hypothetical protein
MHNIFFHMALFYLYNNNNNNNNKTYCSETPVSSSLFTREVACTTLQVGLNFS